MNLTKEQLVKIILCVVALCLSILGSYNIFKNYTDYSNAVEKKADLTNKVVAAQKEYNVYKNAVKEDAYAEAKAGDNPKAKAVAVHNESASVMSTISEKFFEEFYTWNDSKSYHKRADNVSSVATEAVRNNKAIFDDGKDNLGGDYVKTTGVKSEFISSKAYPINQKRSIVRVEYRSWFHDEKNVSGSSDSYYEVTFNRNKQKITKIKQLFSTANNE